jgi:hypothetical membrane protein
MWMLAVTFFVAQVVVAYPWRSRPPLADGVSPQHPYSFFANTISDLGLTSKFQYGTPPIWSPWHDIMNAAFVLLGLLMVVGSFTIYHEFTDKSTNIWLARIGFGLQTIAGIGVMIVGLRPENAPSHWHVVGAALAIGIGTIGVFLLSFALPLPGPMKRFMRWCMPVAMVAIVLLAIREYLGFGPGGMERIATYPEVIWLISFGFFISHSHFSQRSLDRQASHNGELLR